MIQAILSNPQLMAMLAQSAGGGGGGGLFGGGQQQQQPSMQEIQARMLQEPTLLSQRPQLQQTRPVGMNPGAMADPYTRHIQGLMRQIQNPQRFGILGGGY